MRKLTILFALLTLSVGLWAEGQPLNQEQQAAIDAIYAEVGESSDVNILEIANAAKEEIEDPSNAAKIKDIKDLAIYKIKTVKDINAKIGDRTYKLFYNVVIVNRMTLL